MKRKSKPTAVIIDYGAGNLYSLARSLEFLGVDVTVTGSAQKVAGAERIIIPGVGAFGKAMERLEKLNLDKAVLDFAATGRPLLGICLGMQLLAEKSFEFGVTKGLGIISGEVCPMKGEIGGLKTPHMGWNRLFIRRNDGLFNNFKNGSYVYYIHSFYVKGGGDEVKAFSEYGVEIPGVVAKNNAYGMQFHPEKSGEAGLRLLRAFCEKPCL